MVAKTDADQTALAMQVLVRVSGSRHSASFHCAVFGNERPPIVIAEAEIAAPEARWEFRTSGLWADTICETPLRHWSYGLEAFGLEITDPAELLGRGYGDRVPLGWELEFESTSESVTAAAEPGSGSPDAITGYGQHGEAHGLLLFVTGESAFVGRAIRQHWWGSAEAVATAPVLAELDAQINTALGGSAPAPTAARGPVAEQPAPWHPAAGHSEVALPIEVLGGDPIQWWLGGSAAGIRSHTVMP